MTEYAINDKEKYLSKYSFIYCILMIIFFFQFFISFDKAFASYTGAGSIDESALTTDVIAIERNEVLEEAFQRAWKSGQDKVLSEFLKIIFDQAKVNFPKDLKEVIVAEVQEKGLKGNVLELGKDAAIGWIVDIVADRAMMHYLSIPHDSGKLEKIKAIGLASFVWFSIKEIPIIYSSGANPAALSAGQTLLLAEVAERVHSANLERIRETADAPKSKINEVIFATYQKYREGLVGENPRISAQAAAALSGEIDKYIMTLRSEESRTEAIHARNVYFYNLSDSYRAYRSRNPIGQSDIIASYLGLTFSQKIAAVSKNQRLAYSPLNISDTEYSLLKEIEAQKNPLNFVPIGVLYTRWDGYVENQPNIDPVLDDNSDLTDENNTEVATGTPTSMYRGFIAGTVGSGSLFTFSSTTLNNGEAPMTGGTNSIVTTDGNATIQAGNRILDYGYASMGSWDNSDASGTISSYPGSSLLSGHWVMGRVTTANEFHQRRETTGSATYTGQLAGTDFNGSTIGGLINLTADLSNYQMSADLQF